MQAAPAPVHDMFAALPDWVGGLARDLGIIAAILTAIEVIRRTVLKPMWVTWHRIDDTVRHVHAELMPNSGSSLRDAVDRLERQHLDLAQRLDTVDTHLERLTKGPA